MSSSANSRRQFLATAGGASATALFAPYFFSSQAIAEDAKSASSNDRPIVGCIGVGDRWNAVGPQALEYGDCVAVCDVDSKMTDKAVKTVTDKQSKAGRDRKVQVFEDYRKLLERKDIDVITIVTPDHWHSKIAIEAMQAGKDVYCEKPLTLTIDEGKQIRKVLNATGRVFQVGTQQRSEMDGRFLKAVAIAQSGRLGKITKVKCVIGGAPTSGDIPKAPVPSTMNWDMWLGQAPMTDYLSGSIGNNKSYPESRTHYEFRWWYEYSGGKMTDWGAHHIDIATWAISMDHSGPTSVEGTAKHPVDLKDGVPVQTNRYNVATTFDVKCLFANGIEMEIASDGENGITITGTEGEIFVSRGALKGKAVDELKEKPLPEGTLTKLYKGKKPGNHMLNFYECVKTREQPISDVETHHRAMTTAHLANIAIRLGRKLNWNPETEQIVGDDAANSWLKREQRKGYETVT